MSSTIINRMLGRSLAAARQVQGHQQEKTEAMRYGGSSSSGSGVHSPG
jgi:hypothetical protein